MGKVLVVDDNPFQAMAMREVLGAAGFDVVTVDGAGTFAERLEALAPTLVVMDVRLPGISGLTLVRRIKDDRRYDEVPVMVVSGLCFQPDDPEIVESGCDAFLPKPLDMIRFVGMAQSLTG